MLQAAPPLSAHPSSSAPPLHSHLGSSLGRSSRAPPLFPRVAEPNAATSTEVYLGLSTCRPSFARRISLQPSSGAGASCGPPGMRRSGGGCKICRLKPENPARHHINLQLKCAFRRATRQHLTKNSSQFLFTKIHAYFFLGVILGEQNNPCGSVSP